MKGTAVQTLLAPLVLLGWFGPAAAQEKEYPIRTFVPEKVGNQRTVQKKMSQALDRVQKKDDKVTQEQHVQNDVEFSATIETLAVDAQGRETKIQLTIDKLTLTPVKEKALEGIKPGTILIGEVKDGKTTYSAREKGQDLSQLASRLLPRIMTLDSGPVNEHEIFATKQAQKVGGKWQADKKRLVEMFRGADPKLAAEAVSGTATLTAVRKIDGKDYLDIQMDLSMSTTGAAPAPDLVAETLNVKVVHQLLIPADYATGPMEQKTEVTMKQVFKGKEKTDLAGTVLDGSSKESTTTKIVYLKK